jgi:hypothetical protein
MDKWSNTKKTNWRRFWASEMGEEAIKVITEMRDSELERALIEAHNPAAGDTIENYVKRAAGIDSVIQMITLTTKTLKK